MAKVLKQDAAVPDTEAFRLRRFVDRLKHHRFLSSFRFRFRRGRRRR